MTFQQYAMINSVEPIGAVQEDERSEVVTVNSGEDIGALEVQPSRSSDQVESQTVETVVG